MNIHHGLIAFFARFCAAKCYLSRAYANVGPVRIAFLHDFALQNGISPVPTSM